MVSLDLTPVRDLLRADGGDIELVSENGGTARLRLLLEGAECADCVLPRPILEDISLKLLRATRPELTSVVIEDPREG